MTTKWKPPYSENLAHQLFEEAVVRAEVTLNKRLEQLKHPTTPLKDYHAARKIRTLSLEKQAFELWRQGKNLREIGDAIMRSRGRVHQLIKKYGRTHL